MYKITKNGVALDPKLYTIDTVNHTFASSEDDLVLDFAGEGGWIFRIRHNCTVTAGNSCFIAAWGRCNITAGDDCTIDIGARCNINAGERCTINTSHGCNITAGNRTVVVTCENSTITGGEGCAVIKRDTNEVIKLVAGQTIRLKDDYGVGEPIETIEIGNLKFNKKEVEKLLKQFNQLINY